MATGKRLAIIFRPKTISLINNNTLSKLSSGIVQTCSTCNRSIATITSGVGSWNSKKPGKGNVHFYCKERRLHHAHLCESDLCFELVHVLNKF